jgi:hypothetical protein
MPDHLRLAIKQLQSAARNLSKISESGGSVRALRASALVSRIDSALMYGRAYKTEELARAFDEAMEAD